MSSFLHSPSTSPVKSNFDDTDDEYAETASQQSIPLGSPTISQTITLEPQTHEPLASPTTPSASSPKALNGKERSGSLFSTTSEPFSESRASGGIFNSISSSFRTLSSLGPLSPTTSAPESQRGSMKYPPMPFTIDSDAASTTSYSSTSSKKARPESLLIDPNAGPLVLGIALVDFNHLVGPQIEFSDGDIFEDEQIAKILPFLALPDGAHMSTEDYSYFHLVPTRPKPTTIFGISCNRQIRSDELVSRDAEVVTRSTVQKAVVVLASKPVFGPMRDKLGVVTRALFEQRDFRETGILVDFRASLEVSLMSQMTESGLYMGTSLRELVHTFRTRTLVLLKALMLQKRIMFYGHPVEKLCTYQYSLVSLIPGLLQTLEDCGSPPLASRAPTLTKPSSLRTSDRRSLMSYLGLPLDIFGKDAFFQPYLPLQQIDIIKETSSWLCGTTNTIVTQQKEIDLLVNIESNTFEFRDPKLERSTALTAADRKWMDDIVRDVNDHWDMENLNKPAGLHFRGSDDYLRTKFEEYVSAALSSVKYSDYLAKGAGGDALQFGPSEGSDPHGTSDFNPLWIADFRRTNMFEVWNKITDAELFDIVEARHPCVQKPTIVADIGLRLQEGLQDLKIEQQLAPTREAISRTLASGSTSFLKAMEGVKERWAQRAVSGGEVGGQDGGQPLANGLASPRFTSEFGVLNTPSAKDAVNGVPPTPTAPTTPLSVTAAQAAAEAKAALGAWGSYFGQKAAKYTGSRSSVSPSVPAKSTFEAPVRTLQLGLGSMTAARSPSTSTSALPPDRTQNSSPPGSSAQSSLWSRLTKTASTVSVPSIRSFSGSSNGVQKDASGQSGDDRSLKEPVMVGEESNDWKPRNLDDTGRRSSDKVAPQHEEEPPRVQIYPETEEVWKKGNTPPNDIAERASLASHESAYASMDEGVEVAGYAI